MADIDFDGKRDALFLDLDGTIIDLAPTPSGVRTPAGLVEDLARLTKRLGGALAVVSGRPIPIIDGLLKPLKPVAAGVHGGEIRNRAGGRVERVADFHMSDDIRRRLGTLARIPGVLIEDKDVSIAVHYRRNPAAATQVSELVAAVLREHKGEGLVALAGKSVLEIKPQAFDKGTAVTAIMADPPFSGRRPIYIGDDVTDESAFAVVSRWNGRGYAVGEPRIGASRAFADPSQVREWIHGLPSRIGAAA